MPTDAVELARLRLELDQAHAQLRELRNALASMRNDRNYWRKKYIASTTDPDEVGYK